MDFVAGRFGQDPLSSNFNHTRHLSVLKTVFLYVLYTLYA